jgi:hypothetical protein
MAPSDIGPCDLWGEWKLTVSWTRTTYVNGQMVDRQSGGWSEGGFFKIPGVLSPTAAPDGFWKQMGFSSAQMGAREMGMIFDVPPGGGPLTFVIHVTRPKGDPVTTVPFVLTMTEGEGGVFTFTKAEEEPCPEEEATPVSYSEPSTATGGTTIVTPPPAGSQPFVPGPNDDLFVPVEPTAEVATPTETPTTCPGVSDTSEMDFYETQMWNPRPEDEEDFSQGTQQSINFAGAMLKELNDARCLGPEEWESRRQAIIRWYHNRLKELDAIVVIRIDAGGEAIEDLIYADKIRIAEELRAVEAMTPPATAFTCPPCDDESTSSASTTSVERPSPAGAAGSQPFVPGPNDDLFVPVDPPAEVSKPEEPVKPTASRPPCVRLPGLEAALSEAEAEFKKLGSRGTGTVEPTGPYVLAQMRVDGLKSQVEALRAACPKPEKRQPEEYPVNPIPADPEDPCRERRLIEERLKALLKIAERNVTFGFADTIEYQAAVAQVKLLRERLAELSTDCVKVPVRKCPPGTTCPLPGDIDDADLVSETNPIPLQTPYSIPLERGQIFGGSTSSPPSLGLKAPEPTGQPTPSGPTMTTPTPPTTGLDGLPKPPTGGGGGERVPFNSLDRLGPAIDDIRAKDLANRKALDASRCRGPEAWEAERTKYLTGLREWFGKLQVIGPYGPNADTIRDAVNGEMVRVSQEILEVESMAPPPAPKTCPPGEDTDVDSILDEIDEVFVPA